MDRDLPFIDEHRVMIDAPAHAVWAGLVDLFRRPASPKFATYLRFIAAEPSRSSGQPLEVGATMPGFEVVHSVMDASVVLAGRHRFSCYRLVFDLTPQDGKTLLCGRTYATFPGVLGAVYRGLVIHSGAHRILTKRMLGKVRRRAE